MMTQYILDYILDALVRNKFEKIFWNISGICRVDHTFKDSHLTGDILILSIIWDSKDRSEIPTCIGVAIGFWIVVLGE